MELRLKKEAVRRELERCGSVVVALSGGVDSAVLLALALETLGPDSVLAATADSPSLARADLDQARRVARFLDAPHTVVKTREMDRPDYLANRGDRCFHCRSELFETLSRLAAERGLARVAYGAIVDDLSDVRPGMRAAAGMGAVAPLLDAGLGKRDVRALAEDAGLPVAAQPANACLASRIPVGTTVTAERLERIERAEAALQRLGLGQLRVRDHGTEARVELDAAGLARAGAAEFRGRLIRAVREAGFSSVTIDPRGYHGGAQSAPPSEKR